MTRPIYEPSTQRQISSQGYADRQLLRRPSPRTAAGTTYAYFDNWSVNGTGASIPNNNWSNVVTGVDGANDRWFDQRCYDPNEDWDLEFSDGSINDNSADAYNFSVWGFVRFDVAAGTIIGASIIGVLGASNTATVVDGNNVAMVYAERTPMVSGGFKLECYQASGGAADLLDAKLTSRRFELFDGYTCEFAT